MTLDTDLGRFTPRQVSDAIADASAAQSVLVSLAALWWGWGFDHCVWVHSIFCGFGFVLGRPRQLVQVDGMGLDF